MIANTLLVMFVGCLPCFMATLTTSPVINTLEVVTSPMILDFNHGVPQRSVLLPRAERNSISINAIPAPSPLDLSFDFLLKNASFFGGNGAENLRALLVDESGKLILAGTTSSTDFPIKYPYQATNAGNDDGFVTMMVNDSGILQWSTYLGGSSWDSLTGAAMNHDGSIIVVGETLSGDFPTKHARYPSKNGISDGFITKFSPTGLVEWSTYLGGSVAETINDVAVDKQGNIIIGGTTYSDDFPIVNGFDDSLNGTSDGFVAMLSKDGNVTWSTYLGGNQSEEILRLAITPEGHLVVVGTTNSPDFPIINGMDPTCNGGMDIFICIFSMRGELLVSTYLGGGNWDLVRDVLVDADGNILLTGRTASSDFPIVNAMFPMPGGREDVFLTKIDHAGNVSWSTYLGGSNIETGLHLAMLDAYYLVAGSTASSDFPTLHPLDSQLDGGQDGFISVFSLDGQLAWSTYLGGSSSDDITYLATVHEQGMFLVGGMTSSTDFPVKEAWDDTLNGSNDAFLAHVLTWYGDFDDDGLSNIMEPRYGLLWNDADTDDDQMPDGWEVVMGLDGTDPRDAHGDLDQDLMPNLWEYLMGLNASDPRDATKDSDDDGLENVRECFLSLDARDPDSDDDYLFDGEEVFVYQTSPRDPDSDDDGLTDGAEVLIWHTDPLKKDTDGDGSDDAAEISRGSNPLKKDENGTSNPHESESNTSTVMPALGALTVMTTMTLCVLMMSSWYNKKRKLSQ